MTQILYIGGSQRSGSTLLDRMLAQLPLHVSVGELVHIWERGLRKNELCGCGQRFRECDFWAAVGDEAFGGWDNLNPDAMARLQHSVDRTRYIPMMIVPWAFPRYRVRQDRYVRILERLYLAIGGVSGANVIVDSSKHVSFAVLLRRVVSTRLRVVHLVRDARAVAFSLSKRVRRPEGGGVEDYMHTEGSFRAAMEWSAFNLLFELLGALGVEKSRIRYEDLMASPSSAIRRLVPAAEVGDLSFIDDRSTDLVMSHSVSGNPMRFTQGKVRLQVDDAWSGAMDRMDRFIVSLTAWPLLLRYGYGVRRP